MYVYHTPAAAFGMCRNNQMNSSDREHFADIALKENVVWVSLSFLKTDYY